MSSRAFFVAVVVFGLCFVSLSELAQIYFFGREAKSPVQPGFDDVSGLDERDVARIDAWLKEQVAVAEFPSLGVAIVRDGKIAYQSAFGFEDLASRREATFETSYYVASVTKVFTTLLTAMLHERGVIDLDQPVVRYLPKVVSISTKPEVGATITLRQLASQTSGLPRTVGGKVQSVEGRYQLEPKLLYKQLAKVRLVFDPGTDELYSNLGVGLLGHVLELAADKPFERLLQEMVCEPLHLDRTAIHVNDKLRVATGYGSRVPRRAESHSYSERFAASGGLIASAGDLARFLAAQMKPGVFSNEMLEQLHTPTRLSDGSMAGTALGWSVDSRISSGRVRIVEKNGGRNNCGAWIGFVPDYGVGVVVVTNCGEPSVDPIGEWLLERAIPGGHRPVTKDGYAKVAPYTGVRWEDDRPVVRVRGQWSRLVSIDGLPVDRIIEFAQREFGDKARKRFAEDLVELLSKMGHDPEWEVTLGLEKTDAERRGRETRAERDGQVEQIKIRMTEENRDLVRN
jgi:CubicO group peptidase (beta-lactamase class C family)